MVKQNFLTKMLLLCALIVGSVSSAWAEDVIVISEDFSTNNTVYLLNNAGWTLTGACSTTNFASNNKGLQIASGSGAASAQTPVFSSLVGSTATLTFKHKSSGSATRTFTITGNNCKVDGEDSKTIDVPSTAGSTTISITNASTNSSITFSAAKSQGTVIDDVVIFYTTTSTSPLASIALSGTYPTTFAKGDDFSHEGMVVTATYENGDESEVTSQVSFEGYNMNAVGTQTVTVSYTEGEVTKTAQYSIKVKNTAGLAFNPSSIIVTIEGEGTVSFTKTTDATVSFEVDDETIATYDASTGKVTGLKEGTTKITATSPENENYAAGVAECTIKVTDPTWIDFTAQGYENAQDVTTVNGLNGSVTFDAGTNTQNSPKWYDNGSAIRIYQNNTITITAKPGYVLTSVVFSVTSGSMAADNFNKVVTKVGSTNEFTLSVPSTNITYTPTATLRLNKVKLNILPASATVNIPDSHYGTYCSEYALDFSGSGVDAYTAAYVESEGKVVLTKIADGIVPAKTGVVLYSETTGEQEIPTTATTATISSGNEMVGVTAQTPVPWTEDGKYNYILQQGKFKKATGASLRANRAYLSTTYDVSTSGAPELDLAFGDETTGIQNIERTVNDNQYYTLDGRRVAEPTKGLYIVNGKKVVIK